MHSKHLPHYFWYKSLLERCPDFRGMQDWRALIRVELFRGDIPTYYALYTQYKAICGGTNSHGNVRVDRILDCR